MIQPHYRPSRRVPHRPVALGLCVLALALPGCGFPKDGDRDPNSFYTSLARIKTLDPVLAGDSASGLAVGHLYDRLLEYDYLERPYRLRPAMAVALPEFRDGGLTVVFHLRDDLLFAADSCFLAAAGSAHANDRRRVRACDVVFSLLRLADARNHSPGYWILRGKLAGIEEFNRRSLELPPGDYSLYDTGIPGLSAPDDRTVVFRLQTPYPQLLHVLAMPYASVVSEQAVRHYGPGFAEHPVGSGAFRLDEWRRNYRFVLRRNPEARPASAPAGAEGLPPLERVVGYVVQEPITSWLLFLQGNLDVTGLSQDNLGSVVDRDLRISPQLQARGIVLQRIPEYQINYVGFNVRDPVLGRNRKLRQAISLAYDVPKRMELAQGQMLPVQGPIPPGVEGYDAALRNPYARFDLERARALLAEAGFPGGVDPATGKHLCLRFDLGGTDLGRRQQAELMAADMRGLGIEIEPCLSNLPRFFDKVQRGDVQLFRLSWVGDYPDAQNYLQLFYGPNGGSCNRAFYASPAVDALYEKTVSMPEGPERTALYREIQERVMDDCPWIFESVPVTFRLVHAWVKGYIPHHYACDGWKYLRIDVAARRAYKRDFRPVGLGAGMESGG